MGSYFSAQLSHADKHGNIGDFQYRPGYEVNTFWDLGRNDSTAIWLMQHIGGRSKFVGYYESSGEHISHYILWLANWAKERNAQFRDHYWPHDGDRQDLFLEQGRLAVAEEQGFFPVIVPRVQNKMESIDAARRVFAQCDFDATSCSEGIKHLRAYRKEYDERREVYKDRPLHNEASHCADSFQCFALGYDHEPAQKIPKFVPRRVL